MATNTVRTVLRKGETRSALFLGLDPSTVATGWCLLIVFPGESARTGDDSQEGVYASGIFYPREGDFDRRLLAAHKWIAGLIAVHHPTHLAIETPFFKLNARTMHVLSSLGAAFRLAAVQAGLPVVEVAPQQRCKAIGLPGNAGKSQVLYTINALYNLNLADHNEADAVAIAAAASLEFKQKLLCSCANDY